MTIGRRKRLLSLVLAFAFLACLISYALLALYFASMVDGGLLRGNQQFLALLSYLPLGGAYSLIRLGRRWGLEEYY